MRTKYVLLEKGTEMCYALNRTPEELLEDGSVKLTGDDIFQAEVATYVD